MDTNTAPADTPVRAKRASRVVTQAAPAPVAIEVPVGRSASHAVTRFVAKFFDSGWRRAFPWAALTIVCWAFSTNITHRADPIDLNPYIWLAGFVATTWMFRGAVDKGGIANIINAVRSPAAG